jgi:ABC-type thiamine transport system ATPase subunit
MQKQQAASTERSERRPIVVRDIVVAVMGATGAGKSTFIRRVTGNDTVVVGDGLKSGERLSPVGFIEIVG